MVDGRQEDCLGLHDSPTINSFQCVLSIQVFCVFPDSFMGVVRSFQIRISISRINKKVSRALLCYGPCSRWPSKVAGFGSHHIVEVITALQKSYHCVEPIMVKTQGSCDGLLTRTRLAGVGWAMRRSAALASQ